MSKHAQFTAVVKKMATDDKKIVVNLEMVGKPDPYDLADIVDMVGDKVVVRLGNPQMAMNFDEDGREERRGLSVTTDQSCMVTQVSGDTEDEHDDYHEDTDDQQNEGSEGEGSEHDEQAGEVGDESSEDGEGSECNPEIQAMGIENDNKPDPESQGQEEPNDNTTDSDQEEEKQDAAAIDKDALEAFILSGQAPVFDEFTFDFPELLQRKKNGETWIIIAKSLGVSSTKVAAELREYKKRVAEHMAKQTGEESGAV
ncbi:hypothetical protein GPJ61_11545 [Brevibacillus formosus]|uniref:hypothetical protein n=1 Tax=Brevibacillus formosus TaxID=54913 RepID=UPI001CA59144|nr:hypothetical protein [Brevibacillus formosus]MBW5468492.1 hypothetical protein [Brevibacillus formosus]